MTIDYASKTPLHATIAEARRQLSSGTLIEMNENRFLGRCNEAREALGLTVDCCSSCHSEDEKYLSEIYTDDGWFETCCALATEYRDRKRKGRMKKSFAEIIEEYGFARFQCSECGVKAECRPYGIDGAPICFDCGMKNPERTRAQFEAITGGVDVEERKRIIVDALRKHSCENPN